MAKLCEHGYFLEVAPRSCPKCRTDLDLIQREEIAALKVTISRLREYAGHKRDCATQDMEAQYESGKRATCDCGYNELLAELEETK